MYRRSHSTMMKRSGSNSSSSKAKHTSYGSLLSSSIALHRQHQHQHRRGAKTQSAMAMSPRGRDLRSLDPSANRNATWSSSDAVRAHLSLPKRSALTLRMISNTSKRGKERRRSCRWPAARFW